MVTVMEDRKYKVSGDPVEGWAALMMQASLRRFPWLDIASELIDNAIANSKADSGCKVLLGWFAREESRGFYVSDNGRGATDIEPFFRPGESGGNHHEHGSSTFGTGLFAVECHLNGTMEIATDPNDGTIRLGTREIGREKDGAAQNLDSNQSRRRKLRIHDDGGTVISFAQFRKRLPSQHDMEKLAAALGRSYTVAIDGRSVEIELRLNNRSWRVVAEDRPAVQQLLTQTLTIGGHVFEVEWGVTVNPCGDAGCRLLYGAKFFETATAPCGDYALGRFYACIRIPQSAGLSSMDLLKRSVEHEVMSELYGQCYSLFEQQLQESDRLCGSDHDKFLSESIGQMLSAPSAKKHPVPDETDEGNDDIRIQRGRDPNGTGIEPKGTGRKRTGRKGGRRPPSDIVVDWIPLGEEKPMAQYEPEGNRLTYNVSLAEILSMKEKGERKSLGIVGAAHVAKVLDGLDPQRRFGWKDGAFEDIFSAMVARINAF